MTITSDFLSEGAKHYVDALAAVDAFEKVVHGVCRDVYKKYQTELARKIGLKDAECEVHDENKDPANRYAELGVWQSSKSRREWFYVYVKWEDTKDGAPEISACVSLDFSKRGDQNEYAELLRKIPSIQSGVDGSSYYLWSQKELSDLSMCEETLYKLLDEWLACWPKGRRLK